METTTFVAARNLRHRKAALALYRALLRAGQDVRLPTALTASRSTHPLKRIVQKRFASNKALTSPRLLYAAMAAGYKAWQVLCRAKSSSTPDYEQVVNHVRRYMPPKDPYYPESTSTEPEGRPSQLLRRISEQNEQPRYSYQFERPRSKLKGQRQIPVLSMTSEGLPYVRLCKDQPRVLSKSIGRKLREYRRAVNTITELEEHGIEEAILEDEWENLVATQMRRENISTDSVLSTQHGCLDLFGGCVQVSRLWWEYRIARIWQDWMARGEALFDLVQEQRALAVSEDGGPLQHAEDRPERKPPSRRSSTVSVRRGRAFSPFDTPLDASPRAAEKADENSLFLSPYWSAMVDSQAPRLLRRYKALQHEWQEKRSHLRGEWAKMTGTSLNLGAGAVNPRAPTRT